MEIFLIITAIIFLGLNISIVIYDYRYKIIKNKFLTFIIFLLPGYYLLLYTSGFVFGENFGNFIINIIVFFFAAIGLCRYGKWGAGDAKYLIVLYLFIPGESILTFLGNIAIITISYLVAYILWFFIIKGIIIPRHTTNVIREIYRDIQDKWKVKKINSQKNTIMTAVELLIPFLLLFVFFRLIRLYIITNPSFADLLEYWKYIIEQQYKIFFIGILIGGLVLLLYFLKRFIRYTGYSIRKYFNIPEKKFNHIFYILLGGILIVFIGYEGIYRPVEILSSLGKIFTFYMFIFLLVRIFLYLYKICFHNLEYIHKKVSDLQTGDYIDTKSIRNYFSKHGHIQYIYHKGYSLPARKKKWLIRGNIEKYLQNLENPLTETSLQQVQKLFFVRNYIFKKIKKENNNILSHIPILKTFAFSGYIFAGFLLTYFYSSEIILNISKGIMIFIKNFIW